MKVGIRAFLFPVLFLNVIVLYVSFIRYFEFMEKSFLMHEFIYNQIIFVAFILLKNYIYPSLNLFVFSWKKFKAWKLHLFKERSEEIEFFSKFIDIKLGIYKLFKNYIEEMPASISYSYCRLLNLMQDINDGGTLLLNLFLKTGSFHS